MHQTGDQKVILSSKPAEPLRAQDKHAGVLRARGVSPPLRVRRRHPREHGSAAALTREEGAEEARARPRHGSAPPRRTASSPLACRADALWGAARS